MGQGLDGLKAFVCLEATSKNYGFVRGWKPTSPTSSPQFGGFKRRLGNDESKPPLPRPLTLHTKLQNVARSLRD